MKWAHFLYVFFTTIVPLVCSAHEPFKIILEPKWENLEHDERRIVQFGGRWILAGSIVFKKKSKECIDLSRLTLQWNGPHCDKVIASLYEKNADQHFYPIQDFLICDGVWNKKHQFLSFQFEQKCTLHAVNTFYLVLTVPSWQETIIKQGSFSITHNCLPDQFQEYIDTTNLSISYKKLNNSRILVAAH